MLKLDHLTVIAPTLAEGVLHVQDCLDICVPFGTQHEYMGTHNHRLQLGNNIYLEIVALDPGGATPQRSRWFGLDNQYQVRLDWEDGRRLRGWVASTTDIANFLSKHGDFFGDQVMLPPDKPEFDFSIPLNGSLPLDGAIPSIIDHRGDPTSMADIPDLGARLHSLSLEHPDIDTIGRLYGELLIDQPPVIANGMRVRWKAKIETSAGIRELT